MTGRYPVMLDLLLNFVLIIAIGDVGPEIPVLQVAEEPAAAVVRSEHFTLRGLPLVSEEGAPPLGAEKGVMALIRADSADRRLHEREVIFSVAGVRVIHTEEIKGANRRLVWREFRPSGARTWVAEWNTESGASSTTGYGWRRGTHGSLGRSPEAMVPACGPLELMDRMREGLMAPGQRLAIVEPAAAGLSDVKIVRDGDLLKALRVDGSIVCVCPWRAPQPKGPQEAGKGKGVTASQPGGEPAGLSTLGLTFSAGTVLKPIGVSGYGRAKQRWYVPTQPAHERLLAEIRKRR